MNTYYTCKHCNISYDMNPKSFANHVRWCHSNPKRSDYVKKLSHSRSCITPEGIEKRGKEISQRHKEGCYDYSHLEWSGKKHTEEGKRNISKGVQKSDHQRVCKKTHEYKDKRGRVFKFDSSWEDSLADRLDELDIHWERPKPIIYSENRRYFPDFYIPSMDLYLDPKNPYCLRVQYEKLNEVSKTIKLMILLSVEICKSLDISYLRDEANILKPDFTLPSPKPKTETPRPKRSLSADHPFNSPEMSKIIKQKSHESFQRNYDERNFPKIEILLNSEIDFSKFGWVKQAAKVLEIAPQHVSSWMKRFLPEFYDKNCFRRKT